MRKEIPISESEAVFGEGEYTYQRVIDNFPSAKYIAIVTFNISPKDDSELLKALQTACQSGTNAILITNIPNRYIHYYKSIYAEHAKKSINTYLDLLNPNNYGLRLNVYFSFKNHAKIIMTDNIVYWGSSNYSDESKQNFECGTISTNMDFISYVRNEIIPMLQKKTASYYKYNYAEAIANLEDLIELCTKSKDEVFEASFIPQCDYNTNFNEVWIFDFSSNNLNCKFIETFKCSFSSFEEALKPIENIIYDLEDCDELPDDARELQNMLDTYRSLYDSMETDMDILLEGLESLTHYDVDDETNRKLNDEYGMVAYDENLDYYAELAQRECVDEYQSIIDNTEPTIRDILQKLDEMIVCFTNLRDKLFEMLEINSKIDNTANFQ